MEELINTFYNGKEIQKRLIVLGENDSLCEDCLTYILVDAKDCNKIIKAIQKADETWYLHDIDYWERKNYENEYDYIFEVIEKISSNIIYLDPERINIG